MDTPSNRQAEIVAELMNKSRAMAATADRPKRSRRGGLLAGAAVAAAAIVGIGALTMSGGDSASDSPALESNVSIVGSASTTGSTLPVAPATAVPSTASASTVSPSTVSPSTISPSTISPSTAAATSAPASLAPATVPALLQGVLTADELPANYSVFDGATMHNFGLVASQEQADLVSSKFAAVVPVNDQFEIAASGSAPTGIVYVPAGVLFSPNSAAVAAEFQGTLNLATAFMQFFPQVTMTIIGHTDDVGTPESNQALSLARAQTAVDFMIAAGVPTARLVAEGRGESDPVAPNDSAQGRATNRRIEFVLEGLLNEA